MYKEERQISLTFLLGGECLVSPGIYETAEVSVKKPFTPNEKFKLVKPMKIVKEPTYTNASKVVNLNSDFISDALKRPERPSYMSIDKWLQTKRGQLQQKWNTLTENQKIDYAVSQYVRDMGGSSYSFIVT